MVLTLQEWRHWLDGLALPFVVWTDHKNLVYFRSAKRCDEAHPGSRNVKTDALFLPLSCIVGAVSWLIEEKVRQAQCSDSCPTGAPQTGCSRGCPLGGSPVRAHLSPQPGPHPPSPSAALLVALHDPSSPRLPAVWPPERHRVGQGSTVHLPGVEVLLLRSRGGSELLVWLPSSVQWPDGESKPDSGGHAVVCGGPQSLFLEHLHGVCGPWYVPLLGLSWLPASLPFLNSGRTR